MKSEADYVSVRTDEKQVIEPGGNFDKTKLLNIVLLGIVFMTTGSRYWDQWSFFKRVICFGPFPEGPPYQSRRQFCTALNSLMPPAMSRVSGGTDTSPTPSCMRPLHCSTSSRLGSLLSWDPSKNLPNIYQNFVKFVQILDAARGAGLHGLRSPDALLVRLPPVHLCTAQWTGGLFAVDRSGIQDTELDVSSTGLLKLLFPLFLRKFDALALNSVLPG